MATSRRKLEVFDYLKSLGVNKINESYVLKEQNALNQMVKAFEGENMEILLGSWT